MTGHNKLIHCQAICQKAATNNSGTEIQSSSSSPPHATRDPHGMRGQELIFLQFPTNKGDNQQSTPITQVWESWRPGHPCRVSMPSRAGRFIHTIPFSISPGQDDESSYTTNLTGLLVQQIFISSLCFLMKTDEETFTHQRLKMTG